jgi:hypothetical protein
MAEDPFDVFRGYGVPVTLANPEDFLKVRETLSRIGVASNKTKTLWQSCHILHKRSLYAIVHFKELFCLDGKESQTDITQEDVARRNTIANLLAEWGLVVLHNPRLTEDVVMPVNQIKIVSFRDKANWNLVPKYEIGRSKRKE